MIQGWPVGELLGGGRAGSGGREPALRHQRLVDLHDHLLVVLLQRRRRLECPSRRQRAGVGQRRRAGQLQHHVHVGVAQPDQQPLRRRQPEELDLGYDSDLPESASPTRRAVRRLHPAPSRDPASTSRAVETYIVLPAPVASKKLHLRWHFDL